MKPPSSGANRRRWRSQSPNGWRRRAVRKRSSRPGTWDRYEGRSLSTSELLDVFAEELPPTLRYEGKSSLDWFLNGWINGTSLPKLELRAVKFTPKGTGLLVTATILQKEAPQDLVTSVPVYAVTGGKQLVLLGRVFADGEESSFHLSAPAGTHKIVLDPNETVLTAPR